MAQLEMPPIYLLTTHIEPAALTQLESQISTLTFDIDEAEIVLGKISKKERAIFELRKRGIISTEVAAEAGRGSSPPAKRRKVSQLQPTHKHDDSSTASENEYDAAADKSNISHVSSKTENIIKVVQLTWFTDCVSKGRRLPVQDYLIYQGRKETANTASLDTIRQKAGDILHRAKMESNNRPATQSSTSVDLVGVSPVHSRAPLPSKRPALLQETTSEHEDDLDLPPIPEYLHTTYSCERPTPFNPPNAAFIDQLKRVRTIRALTSDKIGVRAYSSSIASLAAYPYPLKSARGNGTIRGNKILCQANVRYRSVEAAGLWSQDSCVVPRMD